MATMQTQVKHRHAVLFGLGRNPKTTMRQSRSRAEVGHATAAVFLTICAFRGANQFPVFSYGNMDWFKKIVTAWLRLRV
jgi:hypothetical protein